MSSTILLIGTLDTKGEEFAFARDQIEARGHTAVLLDVGVLGAPTVEPTIPAHEVAKAAGTTLEALREANDRGAAMDAMTEGATAIARERLDTHAFDAVLGLGGSGNTAVATGVMRALPVGLPKVMVSTMASGDTAPYVGAKDITMMYSVVDIAGLNRIARQVIGNAVGAACGMAEQSISAADDKPLVAATMFGVTTPCVTAVRNHLEEEGYEVVTFHATGSGGRAMEGLIEDGFIAGVADITTTEWCDELVGGVLSAGPTRLDAAGQTGTPQVVSVGALDMVNFGPVDTVPDAFQERTLYQHNAQVTLMRTTPEENAELGRILAEKLNAATGPTVLMLPLRGVSMIDAPDEPFHDPAADAALFDALREHINPTSVELVEVDAHINDKAFANALATRLIDLLDG
ncbi:Tm-1-like ATP-binding domain-containing protein [Salisaeta longa]|uniref:Tm-1-like ATP-binding domain-containing protein n=1 Tax=Salisaeta longa TaxID=503170 RepID=UPI0003B59CB1|nr:Tm-1-like ATP-binding domain-containing protein [Salisaeta longa]